MRRDFASYLSQRFGLAIDMGVIRLQCVAATCAGGDNQRALLDGAPQHSSVAFHALHQLLAVAVSGSGHAAADVGSYLDREAVDTKQVDDGVAQTWLVIANVAAGKEHHTLLGRDVFRGSDGLAVIGWQLALRSHMSGA